VKRHESNVDSNTEESLGNIQPRVGFEVLRAVVIKSSIFWDITLHTAPYLHIHYKRTDKNILKESLEGKITLLQHKISHNLLTPNTFQ
jgi:hypothetical protein